MHQNSLKHMKMANLAHVLRCALAIVQTPRLCVFHAAGTLADALVTTQSAAGVRQVFAAKVGLVDINSQC